MNFILTLDNLIKKKVVVINSFQVCKCRCEIVEDQLLHSPIAQALWFSAFTACY